MSTFHIAPFRTQTASNPFWHFTWSSQTKHQSFTPPALPAMLTQQLPRGDECSAYPLSITTHYTDYGALASETVKCMQSKWAQITIGKKNSKYLLQWHVENMRLWYMAKEGTLEIKNEENTQTCTHQRTCPSVYWAYITVKVHKYPKAKTAEWQRCL